MVPQTAVPSGCRLKEGTLMNTFNWRKALWITIPIMVGVLSFFMFAGFASSAETHRATMEALDQKKITVTNLAASSIAASTAITLIPGDAGTPVANKLADLSGYFLVVLSTIYLEKYLVTVIGYLSFTWLIPAGCLFFLLGTVLKTKAIVKLALKLALFGLVIYMVIPVSIHLADLIESTYKTSIEATINSANDSSNTIRESAEEANGNEQNFLDALLSKIKGGISAVTTGFETILSNFLEAVAVMLVTTCLIPVFVIILFAWLIKLFFAIDFPLPAFLFGRIFREKAGKAE